MTRGEFFRRLVGLPLVGAMAKMLADDVPSYEPVPAQVGYIESADGPTHGMREWTAEISTTSGSSSTTMAWYVDGVLQSDTTPTLRYLPYR